MTGKTAIFGDRRPQEYNSHHWNILASKRERAREIMADMANMSPMVYGSVARGDVSNSSDIDIFVPNPIPSYKLEIILDRFEVLERRVVQATPNYAIKGEFLLTDNTTVSFPLVNIKGRELDFYRFGGALNYKDLKKDKRVPGVDKRLVLIIPQDNGHEEVPLTDMNPDETAKTLSIHIEVVKERRRVLERRREVGRTGVFLSESLPPLESFESALNEIASRNPYVKRKLRE
ncbi:MAG: nucleotidyltransferase domain-containing protein [Archaeoglobaceae archaeon]